MTEYYALVDAMIAMHHWRERFNGVECGYGYDPYKPDEKFHYAEAYGLWGQGYLALYDLTKDVAYRDLAIHCAHWLLEHSNPGYQRPSWGLPWSWSFWDTPATLSYVTTSVFSGNLFLDLYETLGEDSYLTTARDIADWIVLENGGEQSEAGLWLYYANFSPLRYPVANAIALASGYFSKVYKYTRDEQYLNQTLQTAKYVFGVQNPNGSWCYSSRSPIIDNLHVGYTLEGLWLGRDFYAAERPDWEQQLKRGTGFYWSALFNTKGMGLEHWGTDFKHWVKRWLLILGLKKDEEARLWGYGTALRAFVLAGQDAGSWLEKAHIIYEYMRQYLALPEGGYAYRHNDRHIYIRHQAHVISGLGSLAVSLLKQYERSEI